MNGPLQIISTARDGDPFGTLVLAPLDWLEDSEPTARWDAVDVLDGDWIAVKVRSSERAEALAGEPITRAECRAAIGDPVDPLDAFKVWEGEPTGPNTPERRAPGYHGLAELAPNTLVALEATATSGALRGSPIVHVRAVFRAASDTSKPRVVDFLVSVDGARQLALSFAEAALAAEEDQLATITEATDAGDVEDVCPTCDATGTIDAVNLAGEPGPTVPCPDCNGIGRR